MSTAVDGDNRNDSSVTGHPRIAAGVIDGVPWSLFALPEDETNWWTGFEYKLVINPDLRIASWGKRLLVLGDAGGPAPVSTPDCDPDRPGNFDLIHHSHPSNRLAGWDGDDGVVDEVLPFLVAGFFACQGAGVIFRPNARTPSGFSHSIAARVRDVLLNGRLSPAQAWLAFMAAGHYPFLSLEMIADLVAVRSPGLFDSLARPALTMTWDSVVAGMLIRPSFVSTSGTSPQEMDDILWWYHRRTTEVFLQALLPAAGAISSWRPVDRGEFEAAARADEIIDVDGEIIALIEGSDKNTAWNRFEMFTGSVADQVTFDRLIDKLSDNEKSLLSGLIGEVTEIAVVDDDGIGVAKDVTLLVTEMPGIHVPAMVVNTRTRHIFRPLPVGFFDELSIRLGKSGLLNRSRLYPGEITDGMKGLLRTGHGSTVERSYSFHGGRPQSVEGMFHWTQLNRLIQGSVPVNLTDVNARGDWVREQVEELHRIMVSYDEKMNELDGLVRTPTGGRLLYAHWRQGILDALTDYYADQQDDTPLLWYLRLCGITNASL